MATMHCARILSRTTARSLVPISTSAYTIRHLASAAAAARDDSHEQTKMSTPLFEGEPQGPIVKTEIPGPKSKDVIGRLSKVTDTRSLNMVADYTKSIGN